MRRRPLNLSPMHGIRPTSHRSLSSQWALRAAELPPIVADPDEDPRDADRRRPEPTDQRGEKGEIDHGKSRDRGDIGAEHSTHVGNPPCILGRWRAKKAVHVLASQGCSQGAEDDRDNEEGRARAPSGKSIDHQRSATYQRQGHRSPIQWRRQLSVVGMFPRQDAIAGECLVEAENRQQQQKQVRPIER
jgi:hypothetical protein